MVEQVSLKISASVIVPVLNEAKALPRLLDNLRKAQFEEIIIVDGGSEDGSLRWLQKAQEKWQFDKQILKISQSHHGRAKQMNHGARLSQGEIIVFLHADSFLPEGALRAPAAMRVCGKSWGRFDVRFPLDGQKKFAMNVIAFFINLRSRLSGIATGDQAIFIEADLFQKIGGYTELPLMEDIDLSKRLKKLCRPYCSKLKVTTSSRRWLSNGIIKTVVKMWAYRLAFFLGMPAEKLADHYRNVR